MADFQNIKWKEMKDKNNFCREDTNINFVERLKTNEINDNPEVEGDFTEQPKRTFFSSACLLSEFEKDME